MMRVKEMKRTRLSEHVCTCNDAYFPEIPTTLRDSNWRGPIVDTAAIWCRAPESRIDRQKHDNVGSSFLYACDQIGSDAKVSFE